MSVMISVENLSKQYRIGARVERARTLGEAVGSFLSSPLRNLRRLQGLTSFREDEEQDDVIWALRDVSFEVKQGEVVGIIGRNGAGKSTLLKVLSRITPPSRGRVEINGRVSSLLEVGTGFHPELSGRENIYLNGTILGMRKSEVDRKFEEIVDFSGVEKFIDTPVKRYSSGMSVRLAFSVAAHMEPEILIIDEVLAVGDQDFQDKCVGKMSEVAQSGRTVLFVSHNMQAVQSLCQRALLLEAGSVVEDDVSEKIVSLYLNKGDQELNNTWRSKVVRNDSAEVKLVGMRVFQETDNTNEIGVYSSLLPLYVEMEFVATSVHRNLCVGFDMLSSNGMVLFRSYHTDGAQDKWPVVRIGSNKLKATVNLSIFNSGKYYVAPKIGVHNEYWIVESEPLVCFTVIADHARSRLWSATNASVKPGCIAPLLVWCEVKSKAE